MQIRIIRLSGRNPLVGAALLVAVAAIVVALVVFGLALLAGLAAVGGVVLLARRLLGGRGRATAPPPALDPAREVFPAHRVDARIKLPPAAD